VSFAGQGWAKYKSQERRSTNIAVSHLATNEEDAFNNVSHFLGKFLNKNYKDCLVYQI